MWPNVGAGVHGYLHGVVGGAVVDDEDFEVWVEDPGRSIVKFTSPGREVEQVWWNRLLLMGACSH